MVSLLRMSASPEAPPLLYPSAFSRPRLLSSQDHSPSLSVELTVAAVRCHPEHGVGAVPPVGVVCGRGHQPREAVQREWCPSASEPLQLPLPSLISSLVLTSKELACCSVAQSSESATSWAAARQASLSITNSRSLLKLMFTESVMPPNHRVL